MQTGNKKIIGWREQVAFPDWNVKGIEAKIDTGARTSALHVDNIAKLARNKIRFNVVLSREDPVKRVTVEAKIARVSKVRTSSGHRQTRYVVATRMKIGSVSKVIETSLVCRKRMICRMLIGRTALDGDFVVDAGRKYVFGKNGMPSKRNSS